MKTAALVLAIAVAAVQSVAVADCCCVLICKHQNQSCSDCDHKKEAPRPAQEDC